ncbi:MAG: excinuclease ABC subunit UvrA [Candidatus Edwardsbacteria bacterium]
MSGKILIKGAREHNLKNIDLEIPRDKLVVITGLSGSGKSSLAFDTIYAEGQRRYVESLSAYARQFLGVMEKPDVDYIEGLSPAISIEQRTAAKNPRSTVATVTEIYDYLRVLFARIGTPYCYKCGRQITSQTVQQIVDNLLEYPEGTKIQILSPLVRSRKGEYKELFEKVRKEGYVRVKIDGRIYELDSPINLDKNKKHTISVIVDRIAVSEKSKKRLADSLETALRLAERMPLPEDQQKGIVLLSVDGEEKIFSERLACPTCGISYEELSPRMFSFNNPYGACSTCSGLGTRMEIDPDLVIPNPDLTVAEGTITAWGDPEGRWIGTQLEAVAREYHFSLDVPWRELPGMAKEILLWGTKGRELKIKYRGQSGNYYEFHKSFEGVIPNLMRRYKETTSDYIRYEIEKFMSILPCPDCQGKRLKKESLSVKIANKSIAEITQMSVKEAKRFFSEGLKLSTKEEKIAHQVLKEINARLGFLIDVGLDYLTLDRSSETLAGGEAQRIHLATQIGSSLVGVLYVLDEPSIGLHQRDNRRLLSTLKSLRDLGNTVMVVEHDRQTILSADNVIDLGPGAGEEGGKVVITGTPEEIANCKNSITGDYLAGRRWIEVPKQRRKISGRCLIIKGAAENNLKSVDVKIPLGTFTCITGVSGSGKSTLVNDILYRALAQQFYYSKTPPGKHKGIVGTENIDKVINIDQSPIGRTPRSNPATYTGVFTYIRELFSQVPESKMRGYRPGRFSFNVRGGRCSACEGDGVKKIEMHFLPDVYITCEVCKGKRYNRETLEVLYKGKSIADILEMSVSEALKFFENIPKIKRKLKTLYDVGLGYIHLGQSATTLSGGEAQRVKLSTELSKVSTGQTLYILDEPTTGLHFEDVKMLLNVLNRLVDKGNTVLVIEHNLDVIKVADWIIDLGPEGGDEGGEIIAEGTPEGVAKEEDSYTGKFLKAELGKKL